MRDIERRDFTEYCAALAPWGAFMTHRAKEAPMLEPLDFAFWRKARMRLEGDTTQPDPPPARGRPAILIAPVPATGMRYAKPGERPPSKFAPGEDDGVIDRYDAYVKNHWKGQVRRHGR